MKLNIGCGHKPLNDFLNIDIVKTPIVDVIADTHYLPFKKSSFQEIYMSHVLEHTTNPNKALKEVYNITKPNALIIIKVPHAFTHSFFLNPTHNIHFLFGTILYWTYGNNISKEFGNPMFYLQKTEFKTGRNIWNIMLNTFPYICEHLVFPIWFLNPEIIYVLKK